jgi:UDP-N-acetylmuramate: L-alanyl-gamma-D-glutamyl-meso-diaminopimelate ligase
VQALSDAGRPAFYELDAAHIIEKLVPLVKADDVVTVFSNGGFDGIHERLLEKLKAAPL